MDKWSWLLLLGGLVIGGVVVYLVVRPKVGTSYAVVNTYTNTEEWEFIKDPNTGRVKGVRVKREAKQS